MFAIELLQAEEMHTLMFISAYSTRTETKQGMGTQLGAG